MKTKVSSTAEDIKKDNLSIIDSKEAEVKAQYEKARSDLDKGYLGGVKAFEQTKHGKTEDLLGYTAIQNKFATLRSDLTTNFNAEKERVSGELDAIKKQTNAKVAGDQPKLEYLDTLSDKIKKEVLD